MFANAVGDEAILTFLTRDFINFIAIEICGVALTGSLSCLIKEAYA